MAVLWANLRVVLRQNSKSLINMGVTSKKYISLPILDLNEIRYVLLTNFITPIRVIAIGCNRTIFRTTDGGTNWAISPGNITANLTSVHFPASNIGYAVGGYGTIGKTIDGGSIWNILFSGTLADLSSVYFTDVDTGYAVGTKWGSQGYGTSYILKTTNGGTNWSVVLIIESINLFSIYFFNAQTGYTVGHGGILKQ